VLFPAHGTMTPQQNDGLLTERLDSAGYVSSLKFKSDCAVH